MKNFTRCLTFIFSLFITHTVFSQSVFQKTYGGLTTIGYSLETFSNGYVIAGTTSAFGQGGKDVLLMKTDTYGNVIWAKTIGGKKDDIAYWMKKTSDQGFIIVGSTGSYVSVPTDSSNIYIIKTDSVGTVQWTRSFGGNNTDVAKDVIETYDNKFVIVGSTRSVGAGNNDMCLLEVDATGNLFWDTEIGSTGNDYGNGLVQDYNFTHGFVAVGSTTGFSAGGEIPYLVAVSESGVLQSSSTYDLMTSVATKKRFFTKIDRGYNLNYSITGSDGLGSIGDAQHFILNISEATLGINWMKKYYLNSGAGVGNSIQRTLSDGFILGGTMGIDHPALIKMDDFGNVLATKFYPDLSTSDKGLGCCAKQAANGQFLFTGLRYNSTDTSLYLIKVDSTGLSSGCQEQNGFFTGASASATMSPLATAQASLSTSGLSFVAIDSGVVANAGIVETTICSSAGIDDYIFDSHPVQLYQTENTVGFMMNDNTEQIKAIEVYSVLGSKMKVSIYNNVVSTNEFPKGVYFYQLQTNKKNEYSGKFIVK